MAKVDTYNQLFLNISEVVLFATQDGTLSRIVLRSKPAILKKYLCLNTNVKAEVMIAGEEKLDRHKCGACFMVAFEKGMVIANDHKLYERYREKIAIIAGLTVVSSFAMDEALKQGNHSMIVHLNANSGLVRPKSTKDKKTYEEMWAINLRKMYTSEQEVDCVLAIAKELFLIESYNQLLARIEAN